MPVDLWLATDRRLAQSQRTSSSLGSTTRSAAALVSMVLPLNNTRGPRSIRRSPAAAAISSVLALCSSAAAVTCSLADACSDAA